MITKYIRINDDDVPVIAYRLASGELVRAEDVTSDIPAGSAELVDWGEIVDHVDWLEHGIVEWRDVALAAQRNQPAASGSDEALRDRLAERTMVAGVKNILGRYSFTNLPPREIANLAEVAYDMADAMLARRNRKQDGEQ